MIGKFLIPTLIGVCVGICANYLADVLPRKRRLTMPVCLGCGEIRRIVNFLMATSCPNCGKKNAIRYWIVICCSVFLSILSWLKPAGLLPFWAGEILLLIFTVIIITDIEYHVILEQMTVAAYIVAIISGWFIHGWIKTLLGGIVGFLIFLGLYFIGKAFARRLSKKENGPIDEEALGFGDVQLAGAIGFLAGFPYILPALLMAIVLGGIVSAAVILFSLIRKQYQAFLTIPYGPFIIIGGIFSLYYYLV
ncbi:type IV leader peptidase family [Leptolinea tardivitalis]|nr:type IV leader peptidase family [Leptolinea tardivitalis]